MDGAGDTPESMALSQPMPPVLLLEGHELDESGDGLAERLDELSIEDLIIEGERASPSEEYWDKIIGAIEEIVVGEEFQSLQNYFLSTYWNKFSESNRASTEQSNNETPEMGASFKDFSEDKHEHFKVFQTYSREMAHLLETQLKKSFGNDEFDFKSFVDDFSKRVDKGNGNDGEASNFLESEIFEMLFTLIDFVKFKELFMDYKEMMEGKTPNLSTGITLKSLPPSSPRR